MRRLVILPLVFAISACGGMVEEGDLERAQDPIINGAAPNAPRHDAVVSLHIKYVNAPLFSDSPFCSGTLIDDDWVLTAAHCVHRRKPSTIAINTSNNPAESFAPVGVSEVRVHPGYNSQWLLNDIALIKLKVAQSVTPVPPLPASLDFDAADVGSLTLNLAGFGYSTTAKSPSAFGVKLQIDRPLGGLGCTVPGCPSGMPIDTQISYVQNPDGACNGDSGGPAFVDPADDGIDGQWYVGGVTSYGDGTCALYGSSTRVPAFEDWIDSVLNPACKATGTACGSGSECCSGSCLGKGKQKTCG